MAGLGNLNNNYDDWRKKAGELYRKPLGETGNYVEDFMGRHGFQPSQAANNEETKDNGWLGWAKDAMDSGAAGVFAGQARFGQVNSPLGGETLKAGAEYLEDVVQKNARTKFQEPELSNVNYWTDPQGAWYDVNNMIGSMGALGAETLAVGAALSASPIAGAVGTAATKLPAITRLWNSPLGKLVIGNVATTPFEAISEGGNVVGQMLEEGYSEDEIQSAVNKAAGMNMAFLGLSNALQSYGATKLLGLLGDSPARAGAKEIIKKGVMGAAGGGVTNAGEEAGQSAIGYVAQGKELDLNEIIASAKAGLVGGVVLGGVGGAGGAALAGRQNVAKTNSKETESPTQPVNALERVRALQGKLPYEAEDGTNCMRTMGLALANTEYEGQINVDQAVATAKKLGQLMDPENYTPRAGDMAVVEDGNHIVMVTENGGTIQNGASHNGIYESPQSPAEMFGKVKYYIQSSVYSNAGDNSTKEEANYGADDDVLYGDGFAVETKKEEGAQNGKISEKHKNQNPEFELVEESEGYNSEEAGTSQASEVLSGREARRRATQQGRLPEAEDFFNNIEYRHLDEEQKRANERSVERQLTPQGGFMPELYYTNRAEFRDRQKIKNTISDIRQKRLDQNWYNMERARASGGSEESAHEATEYIAALYPDNPAEGLKTERARLQKQYDSMLEPVIEQLRAGMKQGVEIIVPPGGEGRGYRASRNAPWYSDFYKKNGHAPNKAELREIAHDVLAGRSNALPEWQNNSPEAEAYFEETRKTLDGIRGQIEALDGIKERLPERFGAVEETAPTAKLVTPNIKNEVEENKKAVSVEENIANDNKDVRAYPVADARRSKETPSAATNRQPKAKPSKQEKKSKADARFTAKGEKLLPQIAELRGNEITVISKPNEKAFAHELYDGDKLPVGSYTLTVDEWKEAARRNFNPNSAYRKIVWGKYVEAFPNTGERAEYVIALDPVNSRIVDNQISAIKQAVAAYDAKQSEVVSQKAESRFDGKRAESALDSLIGRKQKEETKAADTAKKFVDIFDESELEAELAKARAEMNKLSANPFFNPALMKSLVKIGGIYIQKGANVFASWSARMVETLGNDVKPFLKAAWNTLQAYPSGVKFNDDVMTAVMEYVGSKLDDGYTITNIRKEFASQYGEEYLDYVDAAYSGILEYPTEIEGKNEVVGAANEQEDTAEPVSETVADDTTKVEEVKEEVKKEKREEVKEQVKEETKGNDNDLQATFNENEELNGIEISFAKKPDADVMRGLKNAGYRWSIRKKLWYAKKNDRSVAFAESIGYSNSKVVQLEQEDIARKDEADVQRNRLEGRFEGTRSEGVQPAEKTGETRRSSAERNEVGSSEDARDGRGSVEGQSISGERNGARESATQNVSGNGSEGTVERTLKPAQKKKAKASEVPGHNFQITDADNIGKGGLKTKYKDNVAAIKLLKELESENRLATPEEQKILARYVGWGGLAPVFNIYDRSGQSEWGREREELKELLTKDEYESARRSTLNAHYTAPGIVSGIWDIAQRLGFKGGRVLEPSMGIGNFFGLMPRNLMKNSSLAGVELDGLTGKIAKQLYQKANIEITGFEKKKMPDNFYDLIISNVPFGDFKLHDPEYNKYHYNIHNYFFAKSIDKVRPGGLVIFITGSGTMQSGKDAEVLRKILSGKADMLGAVRLPNTAFKENAGTEVTTDLIVLRKREEGAAPAKDHNNWSGLVASGIKSRYGNRDLMINEYYQKHPDMLIGELSEDKLYPGRLALEGKGVDVDAELQERISKFPKNAYKAAEGKAHDTIEGSKTFLAPTELREKSYVVNEKGIAYQNVGGQMVEVAKGDQKKTVAFANLKQAVKNVLAAQIDPEIHESNLVPLREQLNHLYDAFVKDVGYLNEKKNVSAFGDDPEFGLVSAVEDYKVNKKTKEVTVSKRDIFIKRTVAALKNIETADNPSDALATSLAQRGRVDVEYMAGLLGKDKAEVVEALSGMIYENPITREYESAEEYLSGNVREKLEAAKEAAKSDSKYARNVAELERVQPKDLKPEEISANLGVPWIPEADIEAFADYMLDSTNTMSVKFNAPMGTWMVDWSRNNSYVKNSVASRRTWGTAERGFKDILDYALNQKSPVVYDTFSDGSKVVNPKKTAAVQEKLQKVKNEFRKWVWLDESRSERLLNYYNNNFNNWRLREYDGSHLTLPGYSLSAPSLNPHQKDAVWRILQNGNTLLAHCVGAGKTWTMQAAGMESRRLGISKKPMYVIPNNMVKQFENEFRVIYPNANLLTISSEDLPDVNVSGAKGLSKKELEVRRRTKNNARQKILSRIAMEDWDGIIISHSMFKRIPMSPEAYKEFYREQVEEISNAILAMKLSEGKSYNRIVKELEKQKTKLEEQLKRDTSEEAKDIVIPFEQLGVDEIFVDEADMFKNLAFSTKMTRISGINNTGSQRSMDMYVKTQYLTKLNNGRGVIFATGTPISNTMAEMFTMNRYMDMDGLREKNMQYFDSWAASFANVGTTVERSPDGNGYRQINKVTSFINAPEMIKMFRKYADVKRQEDLNLNIPKLKNGKPTVVEVASNEALEEFIQTTVKDRALAIKNKTVDPKDDNMLKLTTDLRKAALDMRLVNSSVPASMAQGKVLAVVEKTFEKYKETDDTKGTQLIFCDLSTPKATSDKVVESNSENTIDGDEEADNIVIYDEIKKMLMKKGIPSAEIAFMHDAKNKDQKQRLFDDVNEGNVRVLIGSTEKMGAGTNVQQKLAALHHVTVPWRPRDIEQREGRILRQRNENKEVEIFTYVTKDSFDANSWEKLKNKAHIISQAMSDNTSNRVLEDMDVNVLSYAEVEALASGNPLMAEKTMIDADVNKYALLYSSYTQLRQSNERRVAALPITIEKTKVDLASAQEDVKSRKNIKGDKFVMELSGKRYTERAAASAAFSKLVEGYTNKAGSVVGKIGGFDLRLKARDSVLVKTNADGTTDKSYISVDAYVLGKGQYMAQTTSLQGVEHVVMNGPEKAVQTHEENLSSYEKELKALQSELEKPFEYQEKYEGLLKRQEEINKELKLDEMLAGDTLESIEVDGDEANKPDREFSIRDSASGKELTPEQVLEQAKRSIPNGKNFKLDGATVSLEMPSGRKLTINLVDQIVATPEQLKKASAEHGRAVTSNKQLQGSMRMVGLDGIVELTRDSEGGTIDHEVMELALKVALTDKHKLALEAKYKSKEEQCDAYRDWQLLNKQGKGGAFGRLWRLVQNFADNVMAFFGSVEATQRIINWNAEQVFEDVASGKVWESGGAIYKGSAAPNFSVGKSKIKRFVEAALKSKDGKLILTLGKVSKDEAEAIKANTGLDVGGYIHVWESADVRHVQKHHGIKTERNAEQAGLDHDDMLNALEAIESPNEIKKGTPTKNGEPSIRFIKNGDNGEYTVVEVVRQKNKRLAIKTVWKKANKNKEESPAKHHADNIDLQYTSENGSRQILASDNNLSPKADDVKYSAFSKKSVDAAIKGYEKQGISSADTSLMQIPAVFKKIKWVPGTVNIDIGGGKYDLATEYAKEQGVENVVFDPFNRNKKHNEAAFEKIKTKGDTATVANVLNVIAEEQWRDNVILQAAKSIKKNGIVYFSIYEGDGAGEGRVTSKGWQNNKKTSEYVAEIEQHFDEVKRKGNIIEARNPNVKVNETAVWFMGEGASSDISYSTRQAIEYDELLDPEYIRKVNDVEKPKLAKMIKSFERDGYKGRPVVVLDNANEGYIALTGSHRLAAAEEVGIEIPAVIVPANEYTVELLDVRDDSELADVAESLYNDKKISNSAYQLLTEEVTHWNDISYSVRDDQQSDNTLTSGQKVASAFSNTERKGTVESVKDWFVNARKNLYRDWIDKNDALHDVDKAYEAERGEKLSEDEKVYNKAQTMRAHAAGTANALIEGDEESIKAVNNRLKNKKLPHVATLAMALDKVNRKVMDSKYSGYLKENGFANWIDALGSYLGSIRLLEMDKLHKEAYQQEVEAWEAKGGRGKKPVFEPYKMPAGLSEEDLRTFIRQAPQEFKAAASLYWKFNDNLLTIMEDAGMISEDLHELLNTKYRYYAPLMRDFSDTAAADSFIGRLGGIGKGIANVSSTLKTISVEGSERGIINPLESSLKAAVVVCGRAERNKVGQMAVNMAEDGSIGNVVWKVEGKTADPKNCIFTVMENGVKVAYQTIPELYGPIAGYNEVTAGFVLGIARNSARLLRAGATSSPSFIVRNLIRDTFFAAISSKTGFIPIVDTARGIYALITNPQLRAEFEAAGVNQFNYYGSSEAVAKSLDDMAGGKDYLDYGAGDIWRAFAKYFVYLSDLSESGTRMGEFMRARKQGVSIDEAARYARELTLDFSRSGVQGEKVNQIVPFFNACLQGGDKMIRLLKDNPVGTTTNLAKYIILPSVLLWVLNHDEDWYKELDPNIKNTCWCLPGGIRIPKPQEVGIFFGSGVETFLDMAFNSDPEAVGAWCEAVKDAAAPNFVPTLFLPMLEWQANYSYFRGQPITGKRLERLPDELQYNTGTSEVAKAIGSALKVSPVKIDNTIRGYTGTMGMFMTQSLDALIAEKRNMPTKKVSEWTFIRDFALNDNIQNRSVNDFYDMLAAANEQHAGYGVKGKPIAAVKAVRKAGQLISDANKDIRNISTSASLTPDEKRNRIDKKKAYIRNVAKMADAKFSKYFK